MKNLRRIVLAIFSMLPLAGFAQVRAELNCVSHGSEPKLECLVTLRGADGALLQGAKVKMSASMPSMPMAHSVRPSEALPTGKPGEYRGTLTLEMAGVWAVQIDIAGPKRDRLVRSMQVDSCDGGRRCATRPAHGSRPVR
jgi:hypothetical protein